MPKTSTPPVRIPGRQGPPPNSGKLQSGSPMVRAQRQPGEWNPVTWNSRRPETATLKPQCLEEGSADDGKENIVEAKPTRPLDSAPVDSWPTISRSGDEPDEPKKKGETIAYDEPDEKD